MAVTDLTGTKWQLNDHVSYMKSSATYELSATVSAGEYSITIPYTYSSYTYTQIKIEYGTYEAFKIATYNGSSAAGHFISYFPAGSRFFKNGYPYSINVAGWRYHTYNYSISVPIDADAPNIDAPILEIYGGDDATNETLIAWLEANATQVIETTPTEITYNGATTSLEAGQTATLSCAEKKAVTDIVVAFASSGTITYNGTETSVEAGQTATMECEGKKMLSDVVVSLQKAEDDSIVGTWVINETPTLNASGSYKNYYLTFVSNGVNQEILSVENALFYSGTNVYQSWNGWHQGEEYRTIQITSETSVDSAGADNTEELLTWLKANATKQ